MVREVGQRVTEGRKLPVEHRQDARLGGVEDDVVDAVVAVHDGGFIAVRDVRGQPLDQPLHRVDRFGSGGAVLARPAVDLARQVVAGAAVVGQAHGRLVDRMQRSDHAVQLVVQHATLGRRHAGSVASQNTRPCTYSIRKKAVPMIDGSSHNAKTLGTGTPLLASARMILYSRSTACADGSNAPGRLAAQHVRGPRRR